MSDSVRPLKKRKRSGCNHAELAAAHHVLEKFRASIMPVGENTGLSDSNLNVEVDDAALAQLDALLEWMDTKMQSSTKSYPYSAVDHDILDDLMITEGQSLNLIQDCQSRVDAYKQVGAQTFLSSDNLHKTLHALLNHVARPTEASARTWVDAFVLRVTAMMPPGLKAIINTEYSIAPVTVPTASGNDVKIVGLMDYTVVIANPTAAVYLLNHPSITHVMQKAQSILGFFVVEAKAEGVTLDSCLPQVLAQMYASMKKLKKEHIRGALTNGYEWLFIILTLNPNGNGATYRIPTSTFSARPNQLFDQFTVSYENTDLIAAILASWVLHSYEAVGEDDLLA